MMYLPRLTAKKVIEVTCYPASKLKLSKKANECVKAINGNFGCQAIHVAKVASILLGEDICSHIKGTSVPPYTAVVLLDNPNSHNYPLKKVLIVKSGNTCVNSKGEAGNQAPLNYLGAWRRATAKEIKKAFKPVVKKTK